LKELKNNKKHTTWLLHLYLKPTPLLDGNSFGMWGCVADIIILPNFKKIGSGLQKIAFLHWLGIPLLQHVLYYSVISFYQYKPSLTAVIYTICEACGSWEQL